MSTGALSRTIKEYLLFLASPGDVSKERDIVEKVVDEFNNTVANRQGATFRLLRWEIDAYPTFHLDGTQGTIDEQLSITDCAIFVCIFWQRLGTLTKDGKTGTEHEFWVAYNNWEKHSTPYIMLYRSEAPVNPREINLKQIEGLNKFFDNTKIKNNWVANYKDADHFEETFRPHLFKIAQDILDGKKTNPVLTEYKDDNEMLENLQFSKEDWKPVTYNSLKKYHVELSENEAVAFFDGLEPSWKESVSPSIARRDVVHKITEELARIDITSPHIVFLRGLGGEGKSTSLQQALYETVHNQPYTYILWHQHTNTPLTLKIINDLSETNYEWIVASDDADLIEKDLRKVARYIRDNNITNIRFLLTARDTDWKAVGADDFGWLKTAGLSPIPIDLTENDANMIVEKWSVYGEKGLGKLQNKSAKVAAQELLSKARTEKGSIDNSLLGSMLQVRTGKTVQEHLKPGLSNLEERKADGNISLRKAMAYISALHAYNIKIVTHEILAHALECSEEVLTEQILLPLGKEIIIVGKYILIRHTSIAEAVKDILTENYNFSQITRKLIKSAYTLYLQTKITKKEIFTKEEINEWNKLPRTIYFEKDDKTMGIELAKQIMETLLVDDDKFDPVTVTDLAFLYEKSGQSDYAVKVFRENYSKTKVDRAYYYKWGVSEGKSHHWFLDVWLTSISIADGIYEKRKDQDRVFISLSGLSDSFKNIYKRTNILEFLNACYSSAKFGLNSSPDERATNNMRRNIQFAKQLDATSSDNDFKTILEGIKLACSRYEEDFKEIDKYGKFPETVPSFDKLKFIWLESKFKYN